MLMIAIERHSNVRILCFKVSSRMGSVVPMCVASIANGAWTLRRHFYIRTSGRNFTTLGSRRMMGAESRSSTRGPPPLRSRPALSMKEYPSLGADGRDIAESARSRGWKCERIPTRSLGTLEHNAKNIIEWFDAQETADFVLVSLSKGAADMKIALETRPQLWQRIRAWICISGIIYGTGIANWLLDRKRLWLTTKFILWYRNLHRGSLVELRRDRTSARLSARIEGNHLGDDRPRRDPVQSVGFPLAKHLSCWRARLWHNRFRNDGPNDSVMMLEDFLDQPGTVVPIWGADHYMKCSSDLSKILVTIIALVTTQPHSAGGEQSQATV